jgi:Beta-galactosidase/beta-glucuronidase
VQEEIPHWGKVSEMPAKHQLEVSKQQIDEMIASHYNHPSIVMWGMGNELEGQLKELHSFIRDLKDYIRSSDSERPINYVTNTIFRNPANDATRIGDILMINEYIGTWHGDLNENEEIGKIIKANPNRPLVISEFGLCEPAHAGGDKRRSKVFLQKMNIYSKYPEIGGIINFCLNDYRTQLGEEGIYQFRRRVHGSTDIFGEPKPSYYLVQNYCSPIEITNLYFDHSKISMCLSVKNTLPSYIVDQYEILFRNLDKKVAKIQIPLLKPGEQFNIELAETVDQLQILRPNGFLVKELQLDLI